MEYLHVPGLDIWVFLPHFIGNYSMVSWSGTGSQKFSGSIPDCLSLAPRQILLLTNYFEYTANISSRTMIIAKGTYLRNKPVAFLAEIIRKTLVSQANWAVVWGDTELTYSIYAIAYFVNFTNALRRADGFKMVA